MSAIEKCEVVSFRKMDNFGGLKAFCDIRIGGSLILKNCQVFEGKNGIFATFPKVYGKDNQWHDVFIVLDDVLKTAYQSEILKVYEQESNASIESEIG